MRFLPRWISAGAAAGIVALSVWGAYWIDDAFAGPSRTLNYRRSMSVNGSAISPSSITSTGTITGEAFVATTDVGEVAFQVPNSTYICLRTGGLDCIYSNGSRLLLPSGTGSAANSGSNALQMDNGARVDFGNGADDYIEGDGTNLTVGTGFTASTFLGVIKTTLGTCNAANEGRIRWDALSGAATGTPTKMCYCKSDGASNYVWRNLATGADGTATTCG